ncbi:MAG TPA: biotin/lipoyl-containing protein, partial [Candidatus Acidoferrum sp.]|nr:biotin/lipoyl-containing protein [Candidatus Acidoferrum sp.]
MGDALAIRIPHEFVNDDLVKLLRWSIAEGHEVHEGQTLAEVETSKAVIELAAAATGKIQQKVKAGEDLRVGEIVGYILVNGAAGAAATVPSYSESHDPRPRSVNEESATDTRFSKKALELLDMHALSQAAFSGRGLVRERDVLDHLESMPKRQGRSSVHFALDDISMERVSVPSLFTDLHSGKIEPEFYTQIRSNPHSFANLSSVEKCEAYRNHGAVIGDDVFFGSNSYVIGPQIVIGARVRFGAQSSIECRERFLAGQLTSSRSGLSVRGGTVVLGENVYGGGDIQIGGGGNADPYAVLVIGDGTYIGDQVFINICRPVVIGKEVF